MNGKAIADAISKFIEWVIMNPFAFCVTICIASVNFLLLGLDAVGVHQVKPFMDVQKSAWLMAGCYFAKHAR